MSRTHRPAAAAVLSVICCAAVLCIAAVIYRNADRREKAVQQAVPAAPADTALQTAGPQTGTPQAAEDAGFPVRGTGEGNTEWEGISGILENPLFAIPLCEGSVSGGERGDHFVRTYSAFSLCYRESYEQSEWVAYRLTKEELAGPFSRTDSFRADTGIPTGAAAPSDYRGSGYDRGHLAPAGDMTFSEKAMDESFLMSNMSPQDPGFNRGIWKTLEETVRLWADTFGEVFVVTGPVLEKDSYNVIGENRVAVPEYYYKVLLAVKDGSVITAAFILPNEKTDEPLASFAVPADEAERRTGLDFFSLLPDDIEDEAERHTDLSEWLLPVPGNQ